MKRSDDGLLRSFRIAVSNCSKTVRKSCANRTGGQAARQFARARALELYFSGARYRSVIRKQTISEIVSQTGLNRTALWRMIKKLTTLHANIPHGSFWIDDKRGFYRRVKQIIAGERGGRREERCKIPKEYTDQVCRKIAEVQRERGPYAKKVLNWLRRQHGLSLSVAGLHSYINRQRREHKLRNRPKNLRAPLNPFQ